MHFGRYNNGTSQSRLMFALSERSESNINFSNKSKLFLFPPDEIGWTLSVALLIKQ